MAAQTPVPTDYFEMATVTLNAIPYAPRQEQAKGFIAPLVRSIGHILYLVGAYNEERYTLTDEEAQKELTDAADHLATTLVSDTPLISGTAKSYISALGDALAHATVGWASFTDDQKATLIRNLANRAAGAASYYDTEFAGLTAAETDPGSAL